MALVLPDYLIWLQKSHNEAKIWYIKQKMYGYLIQNEKGTETFEAPKRPKTAAVLLE